MYSVTTSLQTSFGTIPMFYSSSHASKTNNHRADEVNF